MRKLLTRSVFGCVLLVAAIHFVGQDQPRQDAEGCNDSPLISRMSGSTVTSCENTEVEQAGMPVGKDADGAVINQTLQA